MAWTYGALALSPKPALLYFNDEATSYRRISISGGYSEGAALSWSIATRFPSGLHAMSSAVVFVKRCRLSVIVSSSHVPGSPLIVALNAIQRLSGDQAGRLGPASCSVTRRTRRLSGFIT